MNSAFLSPFALGQVQQPNIPQQPLTGQMPGRNQLAQLLMNTGVGGGFGNQGMQSPFGSLSMSDLANLSKMDKSWLYSPASPGSGGPGGMIGSMMPYSSWSGPGPGTGGLY